MGLNDDPPAQQKGNPDVYADMDYSIIISPDWWQIREGGTLVEPTNYGPIREGNKFRIVRNGNTISFDKSTNNGASFKKIYTSRTLISGTTFYPDFGFYKGWWVKTSSLKHIPSFSQFVNAWLWIYKSIGYRFFDQCTL